MKPFFTILFILINLGLFAQDSIDPVLSPGTKDEVIVYSGLVKEANSGQSIDFANVSLYDRETDSFITGTTTEDGGKFELESSNKNVYLKISFIGYETLEISEYELRGNSVNFGQVEMNEAGKMLEEVVVTAAKSTTEFRGDKRVFNVGSDLTNSGASALEVLNNVPSVNVDIEGAVTLRGSSGVQILLNGKPSVLADDESGALGNITADMIEKVEVITNPSAKYEAEGTSGIINIVLKKNDKKAVNGSVSVNTGAPHNHSVGLSLNKRTENFNLFTQAGVGYKERVYDTETAFKNLSSGSELNSTGTEARNEVYYNFVLGTDYYINPKNIITLSGSYTLEIEDQPSFTAFDFIAGESSKMWTRSEVTTATNPKFQYDLQYKREFDDDKDHQLIFSAIGNSFSKDQSSVFSENQVTGVVALNDQLTATDFKETKFTYNLDYTKPFNEQFTLETGFQFVDNIVSNDYSVEDRIDGVYVVNPGLTNLFNYDQKVFGTYATGQFEIDRWSFKGGARVENTDLTTFLENTGEENTQRFTNLFPSAHISYKLSDRVSLQTSYSSRIYRPRLWDLNPFFNIRNNFSIRAGNPQLMPEFTDSYELGAVFILENITFNLSGYQRITTDKIEYITSFDGDVRTSSPFNIGTADTRGAELNFKYTPFRKMTLNGDVNYNFFTRTGSFNEQDFDFSNDQWSTKLTTKYKFNKSLDLEITGRLDSDIETVQGIRSGNLYYDLGARYKLLGGKVVANLSIRDVFASRVRESFVFQDSVESSSSRQLGRFISFGLSYGFGKGEAMTYGGGGRRR